MNKVQKKLQEHASKIYDFSDNVRKLFRNNRIKCCCQILSTFLESDVSPFEEWIKSDFDRVISGESEYEEVNGNVCCAEISPKTTKVYDNLAEDAMGNWCEVDTKELRQLIEEWCDKVREFRNEYHN